MFGGESYYFEPCQTDERWQFAPDAETAARFSDETSKQVAAWHTEFGDGQDVVPILFVEAEGELIDAKRRQRRAGFSRVFVVSSVATLRIATVEEVYRCADITP